MSESANLAGGKVTYLDGSDQQHRQPDGDCDHRAGALSRSGSRSGVERNPAAEHHSHARAVYGCGAGVGFAVEARRQRRLPADLRHGCRRTGMALSLRSGSSTWTRSRARELEAAATAFRGRVESTRTCKIYAANRGLQVHETGRFRAKVSRSNDFTFN